MADTVSSISYSEISHETPEYMLLPRMKHKLSLREHQDDESLKESFLDIIKRNDMAPYYEEVCKEFDWPVDESLHCDMKKSNSIMWDQLEGSFADLNVKEHRKANWREMLEFAFKIGDSERGTSIAASIHEDKTNSSSVRTEAAFNLFRIAYFKCNVLEMGRSVKGITDFVEHVCSGGSNWCCRNKLKIYEAVYCMATRNFSRAASLLLDCIPTFESYELLPFKDVVKYTVLASMISLPRFKLNQQLNQNGILQQYLVTEGPQYKDYLSSFYQCRYTDFFVSLTGIETTMKLDPFLYPHYRYYVREMRIRAYSQLLQAYRTLGLANMAIEFGVTEQFMEQELARFIANGRLQCKIDKVSGSVATVSASGCDTGRPPNGCCDRGLAYRNTIKKGDNLLNRLKKLGQIIDF